MSKASNDLLKKTRNSLAAIPELSGVKEHQIRLEKLHGDASNRIYYRIFTPNTSFILMERPQSSLESPSEEISKDPEDIKEYSFLNMQKYLEKERIRVPKIFSVSDSEDLILLEDCGDETLEKKIKQEPSEKISLYQRAINCLIQWQNLKPPEDSTACIGWRRTFDADLYQWEFEHFLEWGLEKGLKANLPKGEKKTLRSFFQDVIQELLELKKCLCHRDFQSRNLLMNQGELVLLDFQDALVAPCQYDLVALLRDSYIQLSKEELSQLQDYFLEQSGISAKKEFLRGFHLQTVQRKLKDAGRFHYIHLYKGNANFLENVPSSYRYVNQALRHLPEANSVLKILAKYISEFRS